MPSHQKHQQPAFNQDVHERSRKQTPFDAEQECRTGWGALRTGSVLATASLVNALLGGSAEAQITKEPTPANSGSSPSTEMPEVVVKGQTNQEGGYRTGTASLPLFTEPLLDTPQSIVVVPRQVMQDQGVSTMRDVLRNVSGISLAAGEGGAQGDNLTIRGFTARSDFFLDGMRDFGSYNRDPFNQDSVEVLKGPSSIAFGRGSTGGVVNQVSKKPGLEPFVAGTLGIGTDMTRRGTLDYNQPLTLLGNGASFRLNMMGTEGDVAGRDVTHNQRFGIAPTIALGLGTPTRLTVGYFHQNEDNIPDYGLPWLLSHPAPVDRENFYGFKEGNFLTTQVDMVTAKLEHDFNGSLTLRDQVRYANYERDIQVTEAQVPASVTRLTPLDKIRVVRNQIAASSTETSFDNDINLTGKFETFGVRHALVGGVEVIHETSDPIRINWTGVPTTPLLSPDLNEPFLGTSNLRSEVNASVDTVAVYALDTLKFGEQFEIIGGFRWDHVDSNYKQTVLPAAEFERTDNMPSWRAGVVYKPMPIGSIYVSAGTSFNPSAESLSLSAATAGLPPEKNLAFEIGTKWELFDRKLSVSAALFRDEKTNARTTDPANPLLNILGGNQVAQGVDFGIAGHLTDKWQVFAGYTFIESEVVESTILAQVGNPLVNAPRHTFSLWTTYELPYNLEIGFGLHSVSSRNASLVADLNTGLIKQLPSYVTFNAMLKYHATKNIDLQLNLENIADKYYYDGVHPSHIVPGAARTLTFTASFKF